MIRSRIVAGAVALFVALFGLIGVRLAEGHDPALAKSAAKQSSTKTTTDQQLTTSPQPTQSVAPVTTSQS